MHWLTGLFTKGVFVSRLLFVRFVFLKSSTLVDSEAAATKKAHMYQCVQTHKCANCNISAAVHTSKMTVLQLQHMGPRTAACNESLLLISTTPDVTTLAIRSKRKKSLLDYAARILSSLTLQFLLFVGRRADVVCHNPLDQLCPTNPG